MKRHGVLLVVAVVLAAGVWLAPWPPLRYLMGFPLLWLLPGWSWLTLIPREGASPAERAVMGVGLSFVLTLIVTLLASYLPGALTRATLLSALLAAGFGLPAAWTAVRGRRAGDPGETVTPAASFPPRGWRQDVRRQLWSQGWAWLLAALLVGAGLRLVNLPYAEFQGDEAAVMTRAARALMGDEAILFQHRKGPAELLLVMASWRVTGITSEWMARLPFALASLLGIAALFLIGRRLDRPQAGGVAALLMAVEGYFVGFGRIVQYQSLVVAFSALGLLYLILYQQRRGRWLVFAAAAFFAAGALAHYDAILALPAGLWLVGSRLWLERTSPGRALGPVLAAGLVGATLLALFYGPFWRSAQVGTTLFYVSSRLGSGREFFNHLSTTLERSAVYDSVYLLAGVALALAAQTLFTWRRWGRPGVAAAVLVLAATASGAAWPQLWATGGASLAWIPMAAWLVGSGLAPGQSAAARAVWLWWGVPALFYLYLVAQPLTHVYTLLPATLLLAGWGWLNLNQSVSARWPILHRPVQVGGLSLLALSGLYAGLVFVNHTPEYVRTFPASQRSLFWTPYRRIPEEGLFGFPYQAGWRAVGYLMDQGVLTGTFDSNEEKEVTDYYAGPAVRLGCATPDLVVTAVNVQDEVRLRQDQVTAEYAPIAEITVGGQPKLQVLRRYYAGASQTYPAESFAWRFAQGATPARMAQVERASLDLNQKDFVPRQAQLGGFARLVGYRLDTSRATPGGYLELTLLWQALGPAPIDYQVFTHLHDGETMRGQLDGQPTCGNAPTSRWQPGQLILDPYRIPIRSEAPTGAVPLTVGMYNLADLQRVPVLGPDGDTVGDNVFLTDVEIRDP